jgi:hypothetical protein
VLDARIPTVEHYWRFYERAYNAPDGLADRVIVDDPFAVGTGAGALLLSLSDNAQDLAQQKPAWRLRRQFFEPDGVTYFSVYERVP